jgi:alpha-ribazole phosphatase
VNQAGGETRLVLVRHAEPEASAMGRCYGKLDVALSAEGHAQARRLADWLRGLPLDAVYASPRRRTTETAEALGRPVRVEEDLREIDFGLFEGRPYEEIERDYPDLFRQWMETPTRVEFPGGESFLRMKQRVLACVDRLRARHDGQTIALVAHGGTCRIVLAEALRMADEDVFRLGQQYTGVSVVRYLGGFPIVERMNATLSI